MVVTMARPSLRKLYTVSKGARKDTDSSPLLSYLLEQNAGIANGSVSGTPINLKFLGVGDGLTVSASRLRIKYHLVARPRTGSVPLSRRRIMHHVPVVFLDVVGYDLRLEALRENASNTHANFAGAN